MTSRDSEGVGRANAGETQPANARATETRHDELVKSLRRAIDRRDTRIDKLTESLDQETRRADQARRELEELRSRLTGLERTLEHRTQTCHRLRELLREARGGQGTADIDADVETDAGPEAGPEAEVEAASDRTEPAPWSRTAPAAARAGGREDLAGSGAEASAVSGDSANRVVDISQASRALRDSGVSSILAEAEASARFGDSQVIETVPDVASELLSPDILLDEAESKRPLIESKARSQPPAIDGLPSMALLSLDDDPPQRYAIDKDVVTIGRSRFSDVAIDNRLISRLHARICLEDGRASIEDMGSTNGVKVNSERVERAELADGDLINLGRASFRFVIDGGRCASEQ